MPSAADAAASFRLLPTKLLGRKHWRQQQCRLPEPVPAARHPRVLTPPESQSFFATHGEPWLYSKLLVDRFSPKMVSTTSGSFIGKRRRGVTAALGSAGCVPSNCAICTAVAGTRVWSPP